MKPEGFQNSSDGVRNTYTTFEADFCRVKLSRTVIASEASSQRKTAVVDHHRSVFCHSHRQISIAARQPIKFASVEQPGGLNRLFTQFLTHSATETEHNYSVLLSKRDW